MDEKTDTNNQDGKIIATIADSTFTMEETIATNNQIRHVQESGDDQKENDNINQNDDEKEDDDGHHDGNVSVCSKSSDGDADEDDLHKIDDDVSVTPVQNYFFNFRSIGEFNDCINDRAIWTLKSFKEYLKNSFEETPNAENITDGDSEPIVSSRAVQILLLFRDLNAILGSALIYEKDLDLVRDSDKERDDSTEIHVRNVKLHFISFSDIILSGHPDLHSFLLTEERETSSQFDPAATKVIKINNEVAIKELIDTLASCKEVLLCTSVQVFCIHAIIQETFEEVDLALRGLLDVDASFAAMMQEAASGEDLVDAKECDDDDRGSRDDRGEAESKEQQDDADEASPSKSKRTANDSSKGESAPPKRSKIPFDITNMTYDEYCCKHYSYAMEMYQKNKTKQIAGDASQANPPLMGPPVPQQQQLHMAQQSHQLQQQAMVMGPMGPVMGQMPMAPMGLGSYYPTANMGYGNMTMGVNVGHPMGMGMVPMYMNMPPGMMPMGMPQMGVNMMPMGMGMMGGNPGAYGMGRSRGR